MIEKKVIGSIIDTYEIPLNLKNRLNRIVYTKVEEKSITRYEDIYSYIADLVDKFQASYEERFFLRLDSSIKEDSGTLFHELVGIKDLNQIGDKDTNIASKVLSLDDIVNVLQPYLDTFYLKLIRQSNYDGITFNFSPEYLIENSSKIQKRLEKLVGIDTRTIIPINQKRFIPRRRYYKWLNDEERNRIRELNFLGFNDANISELIGRSWTSVRRHRVSMGLPTRLIHTPMSKKKQRQSTLATMKKLTGGAMNYLATVNKLRSVKIGWPEYQLSEALILYILRENGPIETPEIIKKIGGKKKIENWKPHQISYSRFTSCICSLRKSGMIKTIYNHRIVADRRKLHRKYQLTKKAKKSLD